MVEGDQDFTEMEIILEKTVDVYCIKSGVTKERIRFKIRMQREKIRQDRFEGRGVTNGLVLVRGIGFFSTISSG